MEDSLFVVKDATFHTHRRPSRSSNLSVFFLTRLYSHITLLGFSTSHSPHRRVHGAQLQSAIRSRNFTRPRSSLPIYAMTSTDPSTDPAQPVQKEGFCQFFMKDKGRYCKQQVSAAKGETYCGMHYKLLHPEEAIECPLGCTTVLYPREVKAHLERKCPNIIGKLKAKYVPDALLLQLSLIPKHTASDGHPLTHAHT